MYKRITVILSVTLLAMFGAAFTQVNEAHAESVDQEIKELKEKSEKATEKRKALSGELSKLENLIEENKEEQSEMRSKINSLKEEINKAQDQIQEKKSEIERKQNEIEEVENKIEELEDEIERLKQKIEELKQSIKETKRKIEQREELLTDRLRNLQRNGGSVKYLEVILGASDFGDFISRTQAVSKIMDQDQAILREHLSDKMKLEKDKQELEDSKAQVEDNKNQLSAQRDQLEGQKESLVADMRDLQGLENNLNDKLSEQNTLLANLQQKEEELHDHKMSVDEERQNLASQKRAFDKLIDELEKQKQAKKNNSNGNVQQTSVVRNDHGFIRPTSGYLSSSFGYRFGGTDFHEGIDIAQGGVVPVKSVASGVVSRSYFSASYGNVVFIVHMVNGQKYTTVYAHMRNRFVSTGQTVSQGQVLGHQGNTGSSNGQHLHFELHKGQWNSGKTNAVNPASYGIQ